MPDWWLNPKPVQTQVRTNKTGGTMTVNTRIDTHDMKDPLQLLANTVLSGQPLSSEACGAVYAAMYELLERRAWPEYHTASVSKTTVHYRTEATDAALKKIVNFTKPTPASLGFHDVDGYYPKENTHGGT